MRESDVGKASAPFVTASMEGDAAACPLPVGLVPFSLCVFYLQA